MNGTSSTKSQRPRRGNRDDELDLQRFKELAAIDLDIPPTGRSGRTSIPAQIGERPLETLSQSGNIKRETDPNNVHDSVNVTIMKSKNDHRHTNIQDTKKGETSPNPPSLRRSQRIIKLAARKYADGSVESDSATSAKAMSKKVVRKATATRKRNSKRKPPSEPPSLQRPGYSSKVVNRLAKPSIRLAWAPPLLFEFRGQRRLLDKLALEKTYPELIKLAHQHLPSGANTSPLDVAVHHGFLPKNLAFELERFAVECDVNCSLNQLVGPAFNSSDIDKFFESLDAIDSSLESIKARLKHEIPLI